MNHRAVLGLVLGFLVFVLSAADGRCEDDTGYTTSCLKHKDFCHNDNVRWPDESVLYTKCKKTCGRCNESSVKASDKSEEIYNSIDGGKSCGDEYESCGNYDQAYCESASHVARGDAGDAKRPLAEGMRPLARFEKRKKKNIESIMSPPGSKVEDARVC